MNIYIHTFISVDLEDVRPILTETDFQFMIQNCVILRNFTAYELKLSIWFPT